MLLIHGLKWIKPVKKMINLVNNKMESYGAKVGSCDVVPSLKIGENVLAVLHK